MGDSFHYQRNIIGFMYDNPERDRMISKWWTNNMGTTKPILQRTSNNVTFSTFATLSRQLQIILYWRVSFFLFWKNSDGGEMWLTTTLITLHTVHLATYQHVLLSYSVMYSLTLSDLSVTIPFLQELTADNFPPSTLIQILYFIIKCCPETCQTIIWWILRMQSYWAKYKIYVSQTRLLFYTIRNIIQCTYIIIRNCTWYMEQCNVPVTICFWAESSFQAKFCCTYKPLLLSIIGMQKISFLIFTPKEYEPSLSKIFKTKETTPICLSKKSP